MKNTPLFIFGIKGVLTICLFATLISCDKGQDIAPTKTTTTTKKNNTTTTTTTTDNALCGDSICKLPFKIFSAFLPSGFYDTGEQTTVLLADSCGETPAYPGEGLRIKYTNHGGYWGASFLNDNNWSGAFKVTPTATKITFYVKTDYSANVTFNAFGNATYGKIELFKKANPVTTPVWEPITINLQGKPSTFATPLNIIIDGVTQSGKVTVVDIKDLLIE